MLNNTKLLSAVNFFTVLHSNGANLVIPDIYALTLSPQGWTPCKSDQVCLSKVLEGICPHNKHGFYIDDTDGRFSFKEPPLKIGCGRGGIDTSKKACSER